MLTLAIEVNIHVTLSLHITPQNLLEIPSCTVKLPSCLFLIKIPGDFQDNSGPKNYQDKFKNPRTFPGFPGRVGTMSSVTSVRGQSRQGEVCDEPVTHSFVSTLNIIVLHRFVI